MKPPPPLEVAAEVARGAVGDALPLDGTVTANQDTTDVVATVATTGDAALAGPASVGLGDLAGRETGAVQSAVSLPEDGRGTAVVEAAASDGTTGATEVFLLADDGAVLTGTIGFVALELERVDRQEARGELSEEEADEARDAILGAATEHIETKVAPAGHGGTITVSGTIRYADSSGSLHPARDIVVEIWDDDLIIAGGDDLLATVRTDDAGNYSATGIPNDDASAGLDVYVRAIPKSDGFEVTTSSDDAYRLESSVVDDVPDGTVVDVDLDADDPVNQDNHAAFSVADSFVTASRFMDTVATMPASIPVRFPSTGSFYNGSEVHLLQMDRFDWDVNNHEYFHYVADVHDLDNNPGGAHGSNENLAERLGKDVGTRLAWGEGQPTFWGTVAQNEQGASALGIPNVGDDRYTDTEDAAIDYSIEATGAALGEDNEASISRALWDVYDDAADTRDRVARGDQWVWGRLDGGTPVRVSDAWNLFAGTITSATMVTPETERLGCVFTEHDHAPGPTAPDDLVPVPADPPTFTWDKNGGGPSFEHDSFWVELYDADWGTRLLQSSELGTNSWTPTEAEWDAVVGEPIVHWVVKGRQTDAPETGIYVSCKRTFVSAKLDVAFVIDATGSMADDISAVRAAANDIIDVLVDSGRDFRLSLASYKDHPCCGGGSGDYPYLAHVPWTDDDAAVRAGLDSISVTGGGDFPESVFSGIMGAIGGSGIGPWRDDATRAIIAMGDAPPHDPEPVTGFTSDSVIAAANAGGVDVTKPAGVVSAGAVSPAAVTPAASGPPISINSVVVGGNSTAFNAFKTLSDGTGGVTVNPSTSGDVVGAIIDSLNSILEAPIAEAGGPYSGAPGDTITLNGGGSIGIAADIVTYEWDVDGDGTYDTSSSDPTHDQTYPDPFSGAVGLRVTDADGRIGIDTAPISIATEGDGEGPSLLRTFTQLRHTLNGSGGRTGTLDSDGGADEGNPIVTTIIVGVGGHYEVDEFDEGFDAPSGFVSLPVSVEITAPTTASGHHIFTFRLDGSLLPEGEDASSLVVFRDGVLVPRCDATGILGPDPCRSARFMDGDDAVLVVLSTAGSTWNFTAPELESIAAACPAGTPSADFGDVPEGLEHSDAIDCIAFHGITRGVRPGEYLPAMTVTRAHMAGFVARLLVAAGAELPEGPDAFGDDDGDPLEAAINALAAAGIVNGVAEGEFSPGQPVTRGQLAAMLVRGYEFLTGRTVTDAPDAFGDDDGTIHERAIDVAASLGVVEGFGDGEFRPTVGIRRDQTASMVARMLSRILAEGYGPAA